MIYCVKHPHLSLYKVGFTCDVERRMREYASHGMWVKPLWVRPGTRADEARAHDLLKETRYSGEWFKCSREALNLLF